jgi:hypothetical protein
LLIGIIGNKFPALNPGAIGRTTTIQIKVCATVQVVQRVYAWLSIYEAYEPSLVKCSTIGAAAHILPANYLSSISGISFMIASVRRILALAANVQVDGMVLGTYLH